MTASPPDPELAQAGEILPARRELAAAPAPTAAGSAALAAAQALARKAAAPATLRAYKADWAHYAAWCAAHGFAPVPAAPATVGAYLASLADSRRRRSAGGCRRSARCTASTTWRDRHHPCHLPQAVRDVERD